MALLPKQKILFLPELFEAIQKAPDRLTRQNMLIEYAQKDALHEKVLRAFMELAWHPQITFVLPEGSPPYATSTTLETEAPTNLFRVFRDVGRFLKGDRGFIENNLKRESYFITILESLSSREAQILVALKDKTISELYNKITCDLFCQVFGLAGWLPKDVVVANPPKLEEVEEKKLESGAEKSEAPLEQSTEE